MPVVAMDCEMVLTTDGETLARVSIVNHRGEVLLDEYVKPTAKVLDYRTEVSGIDKDVLSNGKPFNDVKSRVCSLIRGNILVGHSLPGDLNVLKWSHPEVHHRDLAEYKPFMKEGHSQSLKTLAKMKIGKDIQKGRHNSVEDARIAMEIYNKEAANWNKQ